MCPTVAANNPLGALRYNGKPLGTGSLLSAKLIRTQRLENVRKAAQRPLSGTRRAHFLSNRAGGYGNLWKGRTGAAGQPRSYMSGLQVTAASTEPPARSGPAHAHFGLQQGPADQPPPEEPLCGKEQNQRRGYGNEVSHVGVANLALPG